MSSYSIQMQKSKSILRYRSILIKKLTILFRFMDAFIFLTIISTFSTHLPSSAVNFSGDRFHFRGISISFTNYSPIFFAFVTGNAIILLLLIFRSRDGGDDDNNNGGIDFYNEHFKSLIDSDTTRPMDASVVVVSSNDGYNKICRSRSEDLMRGRRGGEDEVTHRRLRRSVTERRRLDRRRRCAAEEDEMSGEEFRRIVEAFIARQQKSLRDQEFFSPIVTYLN